MVTIEVKSKSKTYEKPGGGTGGSNGGGTCGCNSSTIRPLDKE
jgi:hypothetical protein